MASAKARVGQVLALGMVVLVLDQVSKLLMLARLSPHETEQIVPGFFNLVMVHNRGALFGFLNRGDISWQRGLFIVASLVAVGLIIWLARSLSPSDKLGRAGLGLVLGGALGNLVDRVRLGYVVDFLDFHVGNWHWPAFNVADSAISVGVGLLVLTMIFFKPATNS